MKYNAVDVSGRGYDIMPNMIGMFIRYDEHLPRPGNAKPAIFLFEEKLVRAYIEVFEPLEEIG